MKNTNTKAAQHTPGEWTVKVAWGFNRIYVQAKGAAVAMLGTGNPKRSKEQMLADARLIAAAPELLEACKVLYHKLDGLIRDERISTEFIGDDAAMHYDLNDAYRAIARAEGLEG